MAKLIVQASNARREYELGAMTTIGRHPHNIIQILDRIVSKEHAQVIRQPDGHFLYRDLGSLNGSFFKNERVGERILAEGDEIVLGGTQLIFQEQSSQASQAAQRVSIQQAALPSADSPESPGRKRRRVPARAPDLRSRNPAPRLREVAFGLRAGPLHRA